MLYTMILKKIAYGEYLSMFQTGKKTDREKKIFHAFLPRNFSVIGFVLLQVVLTRKSIEMPTKGTKHVTLTQKIKFT